MSGLSSAKPTATAVKRTYAEGVRREVHAAASGRKICATPREGLNGKAKPWRESLTRRDNAENHRRLVGKTRGAPSALQEQKIDNLTFAFAFEYDRAHRPESITYPGGFKTKLKYADADYLESVTKDGEPWDYVNYCMGGYNVTETGVTFTKDTYQVMRRIGNGINTSITYEPVTHHPKGVTTTDGSGTQLENTAYSYDLNDNITKIQDNLDTTLTQNFDYDALNRLTKATGAYGTIQYEYNPYGNLTRKTTTCGSFVDDMVLGYGDSTHPHAVNSTTNGSTYTYDTNGNMTNRHAVKRYLDKDNNAQIKITNNTMTYNAHNMVKEITTDGKTETYTYDHAGKRIKKETSDSKTYNIGGLYELVIVPSGTNQETRYITGINGELVAQVTTKNPTLTYYAANPFKELVFHQNKVLKTIGQTYRILTEYNPWIDKALRNIPKVIIFAGIVLFATGMSYRIWRRKEIATNKLTGDLASITAYLFIFFGGMTSCGPQTQNPPTMTDDNPVNPDPPTPPTPPTTDATGQPLEGTYYFHPNQLGSIQYVTNSKGEVVYRTNYTPYGEKIEAKTTGDRSIRYTYTSQEEDETGLMYYGARFYDPQIGRFTSADTIVDGVDEAAGFNRYMYCHGNPINYNDPTGHQSAGEGGTGDGDGSGEGEGNGDGSGGGHGGPPAGVGIGSTGGESESCSNTSDPTAVSTLTELSLINNPLVNMRRAQALFGNDNGVGHEGEYGNAPVSTNMETDSDGDISNGITPTQPATVNTPSAPTTNVTGGGGGVMLPITNGHINAGFNDSGYHHGDHNGVDIPAPRGTPVHSVGDGDVIYSDFSPGGDGFGGYGNVVAILHPNNIVSFYGHNSRNRVRRGDHVIKGQVIADVGNTGGYSTGNHVHFGVLRYDPIRRGIIFPGNIGQYLNPLTTPIP